MVGGWCRRKNEEEKTRRRRKDRYICSDSEDSEEAGGSESGGPEGGERKDRTPASATALGIRATRKRRAKYLSETESGTEEDT